MLILEFGAFLGLLAHSSDGGNISPNFPDLGEVRKGVWPMGNAEVGHYYFRLLVLSASLGANVEHFSNRKTFAFFKNSLTEM